MSSRSGELALRPLPAVLLDLHGEFATGKLTLKRGRINKTVALVNGNPVSTASSPRDETLGHFLVGAGVISEDDHRRAVARAAELGGKLGEALVALQVLTIEQLIDQLGRQARHKLVQALRWPQGAWRFDPAPPIEGMQLRMIEIVLEGLKETALDDVGRLARLDGMRFALTPRGRQLGRELKRVYGEAVVRALAQPASIDELERAVGDRAQARVAIDALMLCDAVEASVQQVGLGADPGAVEPPHVGRAPTRPPAPGSALFDLLFDDIGTAADGSAPIELIDPETEDSGVVPISTFVEALDERDHASQAADALAAEHQRIQGLDHYAVLLVGPRATAEEIEAAYAVRVALAQRDAGPASDPHQRGRLAELRRAYEIARAELLDASRRAAYDRELAGGELVQGPPAIDTELAFRIAEELMGKRQWEQAIGHLRAVIARAPDEADYHAALGWAAWMGGGRGPEAADQARPHLNTALEINPDHAPAHEYKGRIDAALRSDDAEAVFHLERAIDLDPARGDALAALEALLIARGELRRYERVLKRLLFRLRGKATPEEARAWARLAVLYRDHLDDPHAAAAAAGNAHRIAATDPEVQALIAAPDPSAEGREPLRAGWREALGDPASGAALVRSTEASGHVDAAFLAASTMVALGTADDQMAELYETHRPRGVTLGRSLGREHWALLRHPDDSTELGALMELVAPAVHAVAPMSLADGELDPSQQLEDADLPASFLRLRQRIAALLGVEPAPVYPRVELGAQIHVLACDPPVLIAGDDALTAPERPELAFRLVRAMTFLWPGRAVGASRPGRVLRAVVLAVFREASGSTVGLDQPLAAEASAAVAELAMPVRVQARAAALRLLSRGGGLNLSLWARALARTADRAGMLLCGDVPAAFAGAREAGDLDRDLVEFAFSAAHVQLRAQLGMSR